MKQRIESMAKVFWGFAVCIFFTKDLLFGRMEVYASGGEEDPYVIISVDASDESGQVMYALDTDDPSAFTENGEFSVQEGTSHTIYVKDAAGNITSQVYGAGEIGSEAESEMKDVEEPDQQINIDLKIGNEENRKKDDYEYLTDTPVDNGQATVTEKTTTNGTDTEAKVFYTITTAEGEAFYMVIDQSQSADNVYLLTKVTKEDLGALAALQEEEAEEGDSLLQTLAFSDMEEKAEEGEVKKKGNSTAGDWIIYILVLAAVGGGYYYLKIYKPKKAAEMDLENAMEMDEFEMEEEEEKEQEEDGYRFSELQEQKKKMLEDIMEEDE